MSRPPPQQHQSAPGPSSSLTMQSQSGTANAPAGPSGSQQGLGTGQQSQQQQQQPQSQPQQPPPQRQLHPEIRSIVNLSTAHAHKIYFSGPLVKHVERHTDGKIVGKDEPWREVWAQLGGTTLSVWDMKEIEEASKRGTEVPPTYLNITDASIHVLGAVTMPGPDGTPVKYSNVITLTTAGLNLLLFSCPSPQALVAWTAALRLSAYEKSRLEELYTAHLLRMSLSENGICKCLYVLMLYQSFVLTTALQGKTLARHSSTVVWKVGSKSALTARPTGSVSGWLLKPVKTVPSTPP